MNILYLLIGVSLIAALSFLVMFIWAVKTGQYEDTYTPSVRILFEDDVENDDGTAQEKNKELDIN